MSEMVYLLSFTVTSLPSTSTFEILYSLFGVKVNSVLVPSFTSMVPEGLIFPISKNEKSEIKFSGFFSVSVLK